MSRGKTWRDKLVIGNIKVLRACKYSAILKSYRAKFYVYHFFITTVKILGRRGKVITVTTKLNYNAWAVEEDRVSKPWVQVLVIWVKCEQVTLACLGLNYLAFCWLIGKDPDAGKDWRQEEKVTTENQMVGWHHQLNGPEFEQTPGVGDGQGSLACCISWGRKESDTTKPLNWTELTIGTPTVPTIMRIKWDNYLSCLDTVWPKHMLLDYYSLSPLILTTSNPCSLTYHSKRLFTTNYFSTQILSVAPHYLPQKFQIHWSLASGFFSNLIISFPTTTHFTRFRIHFFFIKVWLIYNAVLAYGIQQSDSVIYIFHILLHYGLL